jgi:methylated-DNA-[protein]-cysteine S-methyltransferase
MKRLKERTNNLKKNYFNYNTLFGRVLIVSDGKSITEIKLNNETDHAGENKANTQTDRAAKELEEYFSGKRKKFDIPLNPYGTEFKLSVWKALLDIPYGETRSYKQIAQAIGNPQACRAVGMANNKNPIWIVIPCHRVIGADGTLTGYGGGLDMKRKLLELESKNK